jgi:cysteine desulfurase/selenocysteine lyase
MKSEVMPTKEQDAGKFDAARYRKDFPVLQELVYGKPLVYLDNAATTQKPQTVIDRVNQYYARENANIHRGVFCLSEKATLSYESARHKIQKFIHASSEKEIIFTRGTTESINLVAYSFGQKYIKAGDEILISLLEHHSNIVPWQMLCQRTGAQLRVAPINDRGEILLQDMLGMLNPKTKLVAVGHVSNALGTINPVKQIIQAAHAKKIPVLIDGAQAVSHLPVDVQDLDCDFYVFSGHKMFGPTGVGVLYGKESWLEAMPPFLGGGDMIRSVSFEKTTYNDLPYKFEAGTPDIVGVIGWGAAIDYLQAVGMDRIQAYEQELLQYATDQLAAIPGLRIVGTAKEKAAVVSFVLGTAHAHDIGTILDRDGVAIRAGHHCAMPVMERFGVAATARASFAFYNTKQDVDVLVRALHRVMEVFK